MRAIGEELRRVFRLTFDEEVWQAIRERRSHPAWGADLPLRHGFFVAVPVFVVGMAVVFGLFGRSMGGSLVRFYAYALPVSVLANLVWLGVAARLRARSGKP